MLPAHTPLHRTACAALLALLGACGGGGDAPSPSAPAPGAQIQAAAVSLGASVAGQPVDLAVAHSANGDGFVVWMTDDGTRRNLWAARYDAATGTWSEPVDIERSDNDLLATVVFVNADAAGNAMAVWYDTTLNRHRSARFDREAGAWAAPVDVGATGVEYLPVTTPAVGDESGTVIVAGYAFEPATGAWRWIGGPGRVSAYEGSSLYIWDPVIALDGSGNGLGVFHWGRTALDGLGSNYFDGSTGLWDELPPDVGENEVIGPIPGAISSDGIQPVEVTSAGANRFLAAWQAYEAIGNPIRISAFTVSTRTWTDGKIVVPSDAQNPVDLQRLGSKGGNSFVLWTENAGARTALRALRLDDNGVACDDVRTIDAALGGGAARAELAIDAQGHSLAVWQQFEGGRANDGSRSNIALSRFDGNTWQPAVFAETEPGNARHPRASAAGGQALVAWIQAEGGVERVKVLLQPL